MKNTLSRCLTLLLCGISLTTFSDPSQRLWRGPKTNDMQQLTTDLIQYNVDTLATANSHCASIAFPKLARSIFIQHSNIDALLTLKEQNCPAWNKDLKRDESSLQSLNHLTFYAFIIINYPDPTSQLLTITPPQYQDPIKSIAGMPTDNSGWVFTPANSDVTEVLTH